MKASFFLVATVLAVVGAVAILGAVFGGGEYEPWVYLNLSASVPRGLYVRGGRFNETLETCPWVMVPKPHPWRGPMLKRLQSAAELRCADKSYPVIQLRKRAGSWALVSAHPQGADSCLVGLFSAEELRLLARCYRYSSLNWGQQ